MGDEGVLGGDQPKRVIGVFLDHNVWDMLLALRLGLFVELPSDELGIGITEKQSLRSWRRLRRIRR